MAFKCLSCNHIPFMLYVDLALNSKINITNTILIVIPKQYYLDQNQRALMCLFIQGRLLHGFTVYE